MYVSINKLLGTERKKGRDRRSLAVIVPSFTQRNATALRYVGRYRTIFKPPFFSSHDEITGRTHNDRRILEFQSAGPRSARGKMIHSAYGRLRLQVT